MQENVYSGPSGLFACYLLHSLVKEKAYIGYTPDPRQRLRKHNREITGGARYTGRDGPWKMLLFVGGFATEVSALQFERQWQYPQDTKITKLQIDNSASLLPSKCMDTLYGMLGLKQWSNQPLRVCYLDLYWFYKYGMSVRGRFQPNYLYQKGYSVPADQIYYKEAPGVCYLCQNRLSPYNCKCYCCQKSFCMYCMAYLLIADGNELIPNIGKCTCGAELYWKELLKRKQLDSIQDLNWEQGGVNTGESGVSESQSESTDRNDSQISQHSASQSYHRSYEVEPQNRVIAQIDISAYSPMVNGLDELQQISPRPRSYFAYVPLTPELEGAALQLSYPNAELPGQADAAASEQEVISLD